MNKYRTKKNIKKLLFVLLVLLIIVVLMFPVAAMISVSLKKANDVFTMPVTWIPKTFAFENYVQVFEKRLQGKPDHYRPDDLPDHGNRHTGILCIFMLGFLLQKADILSGPGKPDVCTGHCHHSSVHHDEQAGIDRQLVQPGTYEHYL